MVIVMFAVIGAVVFGLWYSSAEQRTRRMLQGASRWPIADLPEGTFGKIVGVAHPLGAPLAGPRTGRPCVAYALVISQKSGKTTKVVATETRAVSFRILDDSGHALVDPESSELVLEYDRTEYSGMLDDPTEAESALLARFGLAGQGLLFNKGLTYREAVVEIGEAVAIFGSGVREPDPDAPPSAEYRGMPATRLRITGAPSHPLVISDQRDTHG